MSSAPQNLLPVLQADQQKADQSVAGPNGPGYCSYVDVQSILNIAFTDSTVPNLGTINDLIVRASSYVNQVSSHTWTSQQVTEYYDAIGSGPRAGMIIVRGRNSERSHWTQHDHRQFSNDRSSRQSSATAKLPRLLS